MQISKTLRLNRDRYFETHLSIINGVLPVKLTPMEITVLAAFMAIEGDIVNNDRFCTTARKIVKEKLSLSDGGLGNYLKSFKTKEFVRDTNQGTIINQILIPDSKEQSYSFKLIREDGIL